MGTSAFDFGAAYRPQSTPQAPSDGFDFGAAYAQPEPDLTTGRRRQTFDYQSMLNARDRLKSIVPANDGHKQRLDRLISSIDTQIAGGSAGDRGVFGNFMRGAASGVGQGLEFPVELAGDVASLAGNKSLQNYIEENRSLLKEQFDPQGTAGTIGEFAGQMVGALPGAGGIASGTGKVVVRALPSTRLARAIAAASEGTLGQRVGANIITGLPMNAAMGVGSPEMDVPEGATPEEAQRIASMNVAGKIKNLAIGIGADALFGAIPPRFLGHKPTGDTPKGVEIPVVDEAATPLTPERQAQLDQVSAQTAVKVAEKRRIALDKSQAQSQWNVLNPDQLFKELDGKAKRQVYDAYTERRRNSNPNTSTDGNSPEQQAQLVSMDEQLKKVTQQRDLQQRLAETDHKLDVGNSRALERASPAIDKDPNLVYIMTDVNGLKSVNESLGYAAGDQLLIDARDAMIGAHTSEGASPRIFRLGGDELIAAGVPRDKAPSILAHMEKNSIKQYGNQTGSISGAIYETLADAMSLDGKAKLSSRKLEAKARQNIPGRSPEEQTLIDAVRQRINTTPVPQVGEPGFAESLQNNPIVEPPGTPPSGIDQPRVQGILGELSPEQQKVVTDAVNRKSQGTADHVPSPNDPFPPEVMQSIKDVRDAGGLQTPEEHQAFAQELSKIYNSEMSPADRGSALQSLVDDFTPFQVDTPELPAGELTPAVKTPDDRIVNGENHYDAQIKAHPEMSVTDAIAQGGEAGFTTKDGTFLTRHEADAYAQEHGTKLNDPKYTQDTPASRSERGLSTEDLAPVETKLQSVEQTKPLSELTEKQLGKLDDKLTDALESVQEGSPEHKIIQADFDAVHEEYARRNGVKPSVDRNLTETPDYTGAVKVTTADESGVLPSQRKFEPVGTSRMPADVARLRNMSLRKMSDAELTTHLDDLEQLRSASTNPDEIASAQTRINKGLEEKAIRDKATNAIIPQVPKSAIEGTMGFMFGFSVNPGGNDDSESDRMTNALLWAGVAALGIGAVARMAAKSHKIEVKAVPSDHWAGSVVADKKLVSYQDVSKESMGWRERSREWYQGIVRRSNALDNAVNVLTGDRTAASTIPAAKNPAKLAAMFGRWISQSEGALMDKVTYTDYEGNITYLDAQSFREISDMVGGDIKGLGKLMAARTSLEGEGLRKVPLDPVTANLIIHAAGENYHQAADAMRKFDLALSSVLETSEILTPGSVDRFSGEELFASLKRVFDPETGPSKLVRDAKGKVTVTSSNPIKGRQKGHIDQVYNPAETSASMVPQVYRAAELNNIKRRLIDLWEAAGKPDWLLKQVDRRKQPVSVDQQLRIDALKGYTKGMTTADAEALVAAFDPKSLDPRSNVMTVYRDGVLRAYRVDEHVAQSLVSLQPDELEGMWKVLGLPANIARQGVVLNPFFVAKMAFIDGWQATLNSTYGFRPGVDQFIGWMHILRNTPEYRGFIDAGGGHSTLQSHDYAGVKTALKAVSRGGGGPLEVAVKQAREFKLLDAYRTLVTPFAESSRVGEYLRAKNHGASALDAVYAAKHVTANFQQRGGFTAMRGLDRASMFLNPALQGLDQAMFRAGVNPFRVPAEGRPAAAAKYLSKAFVGITLPSMFFWFMNKDDKEINDLRKTTAGAKYWFMRSPVDNAKLGLKSGDIVKIPKPIVDGQVFGTSMEAFLDTKYGDDPAMMGQAGSAIARDIGFNILPTAGVLYMGLQTNQNIQFGGSLTPGADKNLSLEHQGEEKASWVARTVSSKVAPLVDPNSMDLLKNSVTPAGLDYIMSTIGGMIGQDGLMAVSQAVAAEKNGYIPAKEELPIISKVFASYPSSNVMPLRRFYERATQVQTVGATINHLVTEDPTRLLDYMQSNQADYTLLGIYTKGRQDIANYQRAYKDIKDAPAGTMSSDDRRIYMKQFQTLMIETARQVNNFATEVDKSIKGRSATPSQAVAVGR